MISLIALCWMGQLRAAGHGDLAVNLDGWLFKVGGSVKPHLGHHEATLVFISGRLRHVVSLKSVVLPVKHQPLHGLLRGYQSQLPPGTRAVVDFAITNKPVERMQFHVPLTFKGKSRTLVTELWLKDRFLLEMDFEQPQDVASHKWIKQLVDSVK